MLKFPFIFRNLSVFSATLLSACSAITSSTNGVRDDADARQISSLVDQRDWLAYDWGQAGFKDAARFAYAPNQQLKKDNRNTELHGDIVAKLENGVQKAESALIDAGAQSRKPELRRSTGHVKVASADKSAGQAKPEAKTEKKTKTLRSLPGVSIPASGKNRGLVNQLIGSYAIIAQATRNASRLSAQAQLEASEHEIDDLKQTLFPQVIPSASVDADGDPIASVNIDQVIFDSGRYSANKNVLIGERDTVAANLKIDESDKIANAISAYIAFHQAVESQAVMAEVATLYTEFEERATRRVAEGVGDSSARDLFNLRKLETEAERDNFASDAAAARRRLRSIAGIEVPNEKPPRLRLELKIDESPQIALAAAERDTAESQLKFDKADRRPRLAINGNLGFATDSFDQDNLDVRIQLSMNQPINFGRDSALASSRSQLEASQLRFDEAVKETTDRAKVLQFDIEQAQKRITRLRAVLAAGRKRLDGFDDQFLAGQAGLNEVGSIIETYRRTLITLVDDKFSIHNMELELANLSGALAN